MDSIQLTPPFRFGYVNRNLSRGGYPTLRNFRFLRSQRLKTIISLTPEPPTEDLTSFCTACSIQLFHFQAIRTGPLSSFHNAVVKALNVVVNVDHHPIYVHCLDGRRVTGIVVLALRRLQGWAPSAAFEEFWRYQLANVKTVTATDEIERATKDMEKFILEINDIVIPERIPGWLWEGSTDKCALISGFKPRTKQIDPSAAQSSLTALSSTSAHHLSALSTDLNMSNHHKTHACATTTGSSGVQSVGEVGSSSSGLLLHGELVSSEILLRQLFTPSDARSRETLIDAIQSSRALMALDLHGIRYSTSKLSLSRAGYTGHMNKKALNSFKKGFR